MLFFLNQDGTMTKVDDKRIFQGSNGVSTVWAITPFAPPAGLSIAFTLPNRLVTAHMPMTNRGEYTDPANPSGEALHLWSYLLPYSVTEQVGTVGVSICVTNADTVTESGEETTVYNSLTTYTAQFTVEYSALPSNQPEFDDTEFEQMYALMVKLYNLAANGISKIHSGTVITGTGSAIEVTDSTLNADLRVSDIYINTETTDLYQCTAYSPTVEPIKSTWKWLFSLTPEITATATVEMVATTDPIGVIVTETGDIHGKNFAFDFQIPQGVSITNIEKTATTGLVDTYTITLSDGTEKTFTINNGQSALVYAYTIESDTPVVGESTSGFDKVGFNRAPITGDIFQLIVKSISDGKTYLSLQYVADDSGAQNTITITCLSAQSLQGNKGDKGDTGEAGAPLEIYKTYASISAMEADFNNVPEGKYVVIATVDVSDENNGKMYFRNSDDWEFIVKLSVTNINGITDVKVGGNSVVTNNEAIITLATAQGTETDVAPSNKLLTESSFARVYRILDEISPSFTISTVTPLEILNGMSDASMAILDFNVPNPHMPGNYGQFKAYKRGGLRADCEFTQKILNSKVSHRWIAEVRPQDSTNQFSGWKQVFTADNISTTAPISSAAASDSKVYSEKLAYDQLALKAPIASPTFTGTVTVPTPSADTDAANKAYVDSAVSGAIDNPFRREWSSGTSGSLHLAYRGTYQFIVALGEASVIIYVPSLDDGTQYRSSLCYGSTTSGEAVLFYIQVDGGLVLERALNVVTGETTNITFSPLTYRKLS